MGWNEPMNDSRTAVVRGGDVGSPHQYTRVARLDPDLHWVIRCLKLSAFTRACSQSHAACGSEYIAVLCQAHPI